MNFKELFEGAEPKMPGAPSGIKIMTPQQFVASAGDMPGEESEEGVAEGSEQKYLWHGSRQKIPMLEPRQSVDTGGAAGSNQNAIYATSDPKVAIAVGGLTTPDSDTAMFPNDPQMVLFSGKIRKGENVYLHKLPFYSPDGKPQFVQGAHDREFYSIPGVKGIKPTEIKAVPVDKYLNLIRKATPADLELRKKNMKEQGVAEGKTQKKADRYHINKDGKPATLASYADKDSAVKDRDAKYPDAKVHQVGPRGKVKGEFEEGVAEADVTGEGEPRGMFMVVINGRDWKEFTSNKAFTVARTVATKNPTKQVQVRWPTGQLNTVKEGMSESDISGLMAASRLHKEFVVKTDTKSYRVQAQSANVAKEKVIKKFPGATIVSVKEKNTEATLQENESDAVYGAILRRIMGAHLSLLSKYGPEAVMNATEEVADWVGDVDEIGTSDVSGWVRDVFNKLQAEYSVQESHSDDEYDDEEQDSELYSGCYVRDTLDGDHGEIFRMQGQPEERRVQILDRDGRGWYISPDRLAKVDDNDPAIAKYFAEDSWHAENNAWHGGGNEAVDAWHGQSSAGPMAETEELKKETPKTVAKTWDQMTSKEKLSGVKGRTMYNQKTSKYYVVFDVPATGK